jgi:hypothetical protein
MSRFLALLCVAIAVAAAAGPAFASFVVVPEPSSFALMAAGVAAAAWIKFRKK